MRLRVAAHSFGWLIALGIIQGSAVPVYAVEAGRSPFEFATPALSVLL
jgi:hypothetical protein